MDFSETFPFSGPPPALSPDGQFVAAAEGYRLVIRSVDTLEAVQLFSCLDRIKRVEFCCRSEYILCALEKRPVVQVWCLADAKWQCTVEEGAAGVQHACWAPDGQHILVVADFQIRLTVWSLVTKLCIHLPGPKLGPGGLAFSPDGSMLALAERHNCKDFISLFACDDWRPLAHMAVGSNDMASYSLSAAMTRKCAS
ncbi:hypothetical protein WJX81_006183 [Elliptochloris bilobata]|uniref:Uncharacterized protein n=1 Tax=Elliptochloris bilobata TaxID=381761 RepID=A0AAW1RNL1_9CHLO